MTSVVSVMLASVWLSMTAPAMEYGSKRWQRVYKATVAQIYIVHCGTRKGSGFLAFDHHHIVTSASVAGCGRDIWIQRDAEDHQWIRADLWAFNKTHDTALLRVAERMAGKPLVFSPVEQVDVGVQVGAVGHPFPSEGLVQRLTQTALSWSFVQGAIGRVTKDFVQVNMPLMRGYAGAPLFDEEGRVIGVMTELGPRHHPIGLVARRHLIESLFHSKPAKREGWPYFHFEVHLLARFSFALGSKSADKNNSITPTSQEVRLDFLFRDQWLISAYVGFDLFSFQTNLDLSLLFGAEISYRFLMPRQARPYLNYISLGFGAMGVSLKVALPQGAKVDDNTFTSDFRLSFWFGLRFFSIIGQFSVGVFLNLQEMINPNDPIVPILSVSWGL